MRTTNTPQAIERTPQVLNEPVANQALELSTYKTFNAVLSRKFVHAEHDGVRLFLVDTVKIFNDILDQPKQLQAPDAICVGKDSGCLWSDDFHPSPKMHKVIAQRITEILSPRVPWFFGQR
jgi:phospholipase/lecithinase/hemolysin